MPAGSTYSTISTTTLNSNVASYTFSSIPGTYTDLILVYTGTGDNGDLYLQFNGDTGANYSATNLAGNGSTAFSNRATNSDTSYVPGNIRSTTQSSPITHIMNYSNTTTFKTSISRSGSSDYEIQLRVGLWRNTNAITSIIVKNTGGNLNSGSVLTLYGITAA